MTSGRYATKIEHELKDSEAVCKGRDMRACLKEPSWIIGLSPSVQVQSTAVLRGTLEQFEDIRRRDSPPRGHR